jgi:hypothetical protein
MRAKISSCPILDNFESLANDNLESHTDGLDFMESPLITLR